MDDTCSTGAIDDTILDTRQWSAPLYRTQFPGRVLDRAKEQARLSEYATNG